MADMDPSQFTQLEDAFYDDPEQLSQFLRQRAGTEHAASLLFTTSTEHTSGEAVATPAEFDAPPLHQVPVTQPVSARDFAQPSRRVARETRNVPSLPKFNSAPNSSGFVMEREGAERLYQSFGEHLLGDTQPDSQIYKQWTSGVFGNTTNDNGGDGFENVAPLLSAVQEQDGDTTTDGAEMAGSSQEQHSPTVTSPTVVHEDDTETQLRSNAPLTSPLKFETPAMAGHKRDSHGEILSSAIRTTTPGTGLTTTPFFPGGFGNGGTSNGMSLTQLFNATQAGTSPLVQGAAEDAIFQRPSPNFTVARNSSPPAAMSSPIKVTQSDPILRSSSEPRTEYVTMKQSQERRSREVETKGAKPAVQDSWDEPTETQKQRERRRAKERLAQEAAKTFAKVSAPSLSSPAPRRRKTRTLLSISKTPKFKTPAPSRVARRSAYEGPFDDSQPIHEEDDLAGSTPVKQDDEHDNSLDELSQDIPSSARPTPVNVRTKSDIKVQVPRTSSHPHRTFSGRSPRNSPPASPSAQPQQRSQNRSSGSEMRTRASQSKESTPPVTIMDSQPDAIVEASSAPRSKSLLVHSSPSTNQYSINQTTLVGKTGFSSQMISSSMPPMPPSSSPRQPDDAIENKDEADIDEDDEDRVPSSPPPLGADDIVYDEHHYDEHHSADEDEEDVVEQSVDEDVDMDGIPESEHASDEEANELGNDMDQYDHEAQENAEEEQPLEVTAEADELISGSQHNDEENPTNSGTAKPRMQRQSTVPESDTMEDTQPSIFAQFSQTALHSNDHNQVIDSAVDDSAALNQTLSTDPFHTAREQQTISQSNNNSIEASRNGKASMADDGPRYRSLNEIANQPQTQTTAEDIATIEMPHLSFAEDVEPDLLSGSSPIRPGKKRRITYNAKKNKGVGPSHDTDTNNDAAHPSPSPLKHSEKAPEATPSSTMEREELGALAATNAREAVAAKPAMLKGAVSTRSSRSSSSRKGTLKPVNKELLKKSSPKKSNKRDSTSSRGVLSFPASLEVQDADVEMTDAGAPQNQEDDDSDSAAASQADDATKPAEDEEVRDEPLTGRVTFPNRVFALWPGGGQSYYPATFDSFSDNAQTKCNILFDSLDGDGDDAQRNATTLDCLQVRALDLRLGDIVKVNEKGLKTNHSIVGFKDKIDPDEKNGFVSTDRLGYQTVVLEPQKRDTNPKDHPKRQNLIERPVEVIYLTSNLWRHFSDRPVGITTALSSGGANSRIGTPAEGTPGPSTPSLPTKRGAAGLSLLNSRARAGSVASMRSGTGTIFKDMVFAITVIQDKGEAEKNAITQRIQSNGGMILEDGFHTLFESLDDEEGPSSTMKGKSKAKSKVVDTSRSTQLKLKENKHPQFVALITDSHSRRTKHIQALALNIPCLHHRWLTDSIHASKALPFEKYLLPAGISDYLDGAIRSRTMTLHDPTERFEEVIKQRKRLLQGQSVLHVMGSTKEQLDRKKPYTFLTQALGPSSMKQCADLAAAKALLNKQHFDWVYMSQDDSVIEASGALLGTDKTARRKSLDAKAGRRKSAGGKRKRDQNEEHEPLVEVGVVNDKKVKVASDEFLVQSLILGELLPHGHD